MASASPLPTSLLPFSLFLILSSHSLRTLSPTPVFGFWHIGIVGTYMEVVADQLSQLQRAAFPTDFTFIRIMSTDPSRADVEWLIRTHHARERLGTVFFTYGEEREGRELADTKSTWMVRSLSMHLVDDAIVWFIHNKGVTHFNLANYAYVSDWRRMMMYFLFERDWCYRALKADFYDTCGSKLEHFPFKHYSGTFWMAHTRYVRKLPLASKFWDDPNRLERFAGEFWLLHSDLNTSRVLCVHHSNVSNYDVPYPRSMYESARIGKGCPYPVKREFLSSLGADA